MKRNMLAIIILTFVMFSCKGDTMESRLDLPKLNELKIQSLFSKKVFFGHMSVGNNILDGINDLKTIDPRLNALSVQELKPDVSTVDPGLYHYLVGNNSFPLKKIASCTLILNQDELGRDFDIIALKFCYVDIKEDTDIAELFSEYVSFVDHIRSSFPATRVVHITVPLTVHYKGIRGFLKTLLKGHPTNALRSRFNEMLIEKYEDKDPIFDLAKVESTRPDGSRVSFNHKGETAYSLAREYTYDGGHLNEPGRQLAALEFLRVLADTAYTMDKGEIDEDL